jgi:hypothetical protein
MYHMIIWWNQVSKISFLARTIVRMNLFVCSLNRLYLFTDYNPKWISKIFYSLTTGVRLTMKKGREFMNWEALYRILSL